MKYAILTLLFAASLSAHATSQELWGRIDAACASGEVTNAIPFPRMTSEGGVDYILATLGKQNKLLIRERFAVAIVQVDGQAATGCDNGGQPTTLVVTFGK